MSALLAELAGEKEARRAAELARRPAAPSLAKPAPKPRRITPWQQKELDQVEARIQALETEIAGLDEELADPRLYSGPSPRVVEVRNRRAALAAELETLLARWEELESLRG
jgi:ATP-binding cassette subfamily F protein uup